MLPHETPHGFAAAGTGGWAAAEREPRGAVRGFPGVGCGESARGRPWWGGVSGISEGDTGGVSVGHTGGISR